MPGDLAGTFVECFAFAPRLAGGPGDRDIEGESSLVVRSRSLETLAHAAFVSVFCAVAVSVPAAAYANEPFDHDGFQFRAAIGSGYAIDSQSATDGSFGAKISGVVPFAFEVYLGGAPRPGWTLGGLVSVLTTAGTSVSFHSETRVLAPQGSAGVGLVGVGPYIDWYPDPRGGLHATMLALGLVGGGESGQIDLDTGRGFAVGAGLGYDWWVHKRWSVGVLARITYAWPTTETEYGDLTSVDNHIVWSGLLGSIVFQ
jgi:hypothetical protein